MIPQYDIVDVKPADRQTSRTYKIDTLNNRIYGFIDEKEAVIQAVKKLLGTEKYAYLIYDWNYGIGLEKYIRHDFNYLKADITTELKRALSYDDRIISVDNVSVQKGSTLDSAIVSFELTTIFGNASGEGEIGLNVL